MLDAALQQAGPIDILYNNAAIMTPWRENPWDIPAEDFRRSFEVNVISLARICHRLVPFMLARKWGRVIKAAGNMAYPIGLRTERIALKVGALAKRRLSSAPHQPRFARRPLPA